MNRAPGDHRRLRLVRGRPAAPRRRRWKRVLLLCSLLLLALAAGCAAFKGLEAFCKVERIAVDGAVRLAEEEIISRSGLRKGTSLLLVRCRKLERTLSALPEIDTVTVARIFPGTVSIRVQERVAVASLLDRRCFWLLDHEGVPFAEQTRPAENLPVITGAAAEEIIAGEPLANGARREALLAFLRALPENPLLEPAELNLADPGDLILYTGDGRKVLLGDSHRMEEKLLLLWGFIPFLPEISTGSCLDLRTGDRLVVITE